MAEITLNKSASGVWFSMDRHTVDQLKECGVCHPVPDAAIKLATQALVAGGHRVNLIDPIPDENKTRKRRETKIRNMALAIAADLFTDEEGRQADRLVMEHVDGTKRTYGSGWGLGPMADRIEMLLTDGKFPASWLS